MSRRMAYLGEVLRGHVLVCEGQAGVVVDLKGEVELEDVQQLREEPRLLAHTTQTQAHVHMQVLPPSTQCTHTPVSPRCSRTRVHVCWLWAVPAVAP